MYARAYERAPQLVGNATPGQAHRLRAAASATQASRPPPPRPLARPQVNGKKLTPNSMVVFKFMLPLVLWAAMVIVVFGVTFQKLAGLQAPLSSLNAAARVTYGISRVRLAGNHMALSTNATERPLDRKALLHDIESLKSK